MKSQLRRLTAAVGTSAVIAAGLVGGTTGTATAAAEPYSIQISQGTCKQSSPVVTVRLKYPSGGKTSLGYSTTSYPDEWVDKLHKVPNGTYTMTLPKVASGDTETVVVSFMRGKKASYSAPYEFSVPKCAGAPDLFTARPNPVLSGTAQVGKRLTADAGEWSPTPGALRYQWQRAGYEPIKGATSPSYKLRPEDAGKRIRVIVWATKKGYAKTRRVSEYTALVAKGTFAKVGTPKVSGKGKVGRTLTARTGAWAPAPTSIAYRWYRNGAAIKGATKKRYTLVKRDAGKAISVRVTARKAGYVKVAKFSAAKKVAKR